MNKKWTEIEDKLVLDTIPEDGVFTKELAKILKRQLPDRTVRSIEAHWYSTLRKSWLENKWKEAEAAAAVVASQLKPLSFWQRIINLFKSK